MNSETCLPVEIFIKEEISDCEEVYCRLCPKSFASDVALRNHASMDHIEAYATGDPSVWTKEVKDPMAITRSCRRKKEQKMIIQKRKQQIISSMEPTRITSLASNNVSYIIIKSEDSLLEEKTKKKKDKVMVPKRPKSPLTISGPFECLEPSAQVADGACHQIFFSCCEYSRHARAEHGRRRRALRCQVCERPLAARASHCAHPCESCGEGFDTAEALQEHTAQYHVKPKPYECSICHKRFTQQGGVAQHMRMHSGARPFACPLCAKAFTQKSGLEQHLRTHTKLRPYRCVVCAKSFAQSVHLQQHMRTHTLVAPFRCADCGRRFKQSTHLNYHRRQHAPPAVQPAAATH